MNRFYSVIFLGIILCACASPQQKAREQRAETHLENFSNNLKTGMTLEEVKAVSNEVSNCRGSKVAYMECTAVLSVVTSRSSPIAVGDLPTHFNRDKSHFFKLHFEKNLLQRWEESTESKFR